MNNDMTSIGLPPVVAPLAGETQNFPVLASSEDKEVIDSLPKDHALLIAQTGPGQGSRFLLDSDVTIVGRSDVHDILLDDVTVSRKHAEFIRDGNVFSVRDCGSLNGTYVNREQITDQELKNGDEVQIGKFRLTFYVNHS
ncbi:MAG: FHA domain-containing protein [Bifidobacteriaceae bacterium]|jgi:hypothetical protein|nr:FHA domain-containing protein [Bifidobacteriaceae bacterium]